MDSVNDPRYFFQFKKKSLRVFNAVSNQGEAYTFECVDQEYAQVRSMKFTGDKLKFNITGYRAMCYKIVPISNRNIYK